MGTISADLTQFRDAVQGKLSGMSSSISDLSSKLSDLTVLNGNTKSQVSANYQSDAASTALSSFDSLATIITSITSSITSTVNSAISQANAIVSDVNKLEEINKEIDSKKSALNNTPNTEENASKRSSIQSEINSKESEFNTLHEQAKTKLAAIKAMSDTISIGSGSASPAPEGVSEEVMQDVALGRGTLERATYVAENGKKVTYYIYVPKAASDVKLPVTIYFHGLQETTDKYPDRGPAGLIKQGKLSPKGIVIFPQACDGTKDSDFHKKDYESAVMELTNKVINKYNGDVKRISVAGHSNGACAVGHILENFPGVFAAAAPISGVTKVSDGMLKTNLWTFRGSYDTPDVDRTAKIVQKKGGKARSTVFPKKGHAVQAYTFEQPLQDENGNTVYLLDWLMSKTTA